MYTHEYTDEKFDTYEECSDDFRENLDITDITGHLEISLEDIVYHFLRRRNTIDFDAWLEEVIYEAIQSAEDELIFECDEEEDDE